MGITCADSVEQDACVTGVASKAATVEVAREEQPLPGVIDTVGLGYAALLMRPQVLLPPICWTCTCGWGCE